MVKNTLSFKAIVIAAVSGISSFAHADEGVAAAAQLKGVERYPSQYIARPGIMPTEIVGVTSNFTVSQADKGQKFGLNLGMETGIVKHLEAQLSYDGVEFNNSKAKALRTFNVGAAYNFFRIPHMSSTFTASLPLHVADGEILQQVNFGPSATFYNDVMAGSILGGSFVTLKMRPKVEMALNFKWWYGYQVYGDFWAQVSSSFGRVEMKNKDNQAKWETAGFWKELPAKLTMIYAFNNYFDLGANAGFDNVFKAKDTFTFGLNLGVRAGKVFG